LTSRLREVAVRKIIGADRKRIVLQFVGESVVTVFLSFLLALFLAEIFLPAFNILTGKEPGIFYYRSMAAAAGIVLAALFIGMASGIYPALFISRFSPVGALKGMAGAGLFKKVSFREVLVVVQFAIATTLIISTGIAAGQVGFLGKKPLGFRKEHIVVIPIHGQDVLRRYEAMKAGLQRTPGILWVTASSAFPGDPSISQYEFHAEGTPEDRLTPMFGLTVDQDFLETYEIPLIAGRN
ncbi:MAG: FtsX-like permease family protein, partial [Candidatus Latescibacterota bacterium]